ncbi:MAG: 50S ribosomal protein L25 [Phycisphaerae bacterium]|nr:50S ribosomal protein L25 [Phycisphaerae bacterium]
MESAIVKGEKRDPAGRRAASRLRKKGLVPGIIYGHGETPVPVAVNGEQLTEQLHGGALLVDLEMDGATTKLLVKDVQYDHMNSNITHVDLARVSMDERVTVTIPIRFRGTPVGVKLDGGQLLTPLPQVEVECLVIAIPTEIRVNVAELKIGDQVTVKQLELPEGVKVLANPDQVVAVCAEPMKEEVVVAAPGEVGAVEPEVIGKKEEEEGAAAEGEAPAAGPAAKKAEKKE